MDLSRRHFLGARRRHTPLAFRPPWALPEDEFQDRCTRCERCVTACPTGLLVKGEGGYPEANFTPAHAPAGCTFCGDCVMACEPAALQQRADRLPWQLGIAFGEDCLPFQGIVCRSCAESCDADAIRFPPRLGGVSHPLLDESLCTGCAQCLADCPTYAIRIVRSASHSHTLQGAA